MWTAHCRRGRLRSDLRRGSSIGQGDSGDGATKPAPPACEILAPDEQTVPFVSTSPHSGRYYPAEFLAATCLDTNDIRRSEDLYVDSLFSFVVRLGAPLMSAVYPRAYLDVNREP